jgi:hypothetical protein
LGDGELRIIASQDIGSLGPKEGTPVLFHWRWYYSVPTLPIWALILLLLILPKANRQAQAWLILIPLGLVLVVWRMPATLLSVPDGPTETLGFYVASVAMAWSTVWLLGDWLAAGNRIVTFFLALGTMLAVGLLSYYCHYENADGLVSSLTSCGMAAAIVLLAMMWSSAICRKGYTPRGFSLWLLLWTGVAALGVLLSVAAISTIVVMILQPWIEIAAQLARMAIVAAIASAFVGGILYVLNLPFLILAFKSPFYRDRFESIFRLKKRVAVVDGSGTHQEDVADADGSGES